jgi:hypothetical protein
VLTHLSRNYEGWTLNRGCILFSHDSVISDYHRFCCSDNTLPWLARESERVQPLAALAHIYTITADSDRRSLVPVAGILWTRFSVYVLSATPLFSVPPIVREVLRMFIKLDN